jgi:hypothetical protein
MAACAALWRIFSLDIYGPANGQEGFFPRISGLYRGLTLLKIKILKHVVVS